MKKTIWISVLTTLVAVIGAVIGAYVVMLRRDKEMAEYEQMLIRQDIPDAKWDAEAGETEETDEAEKADEPVVEETTEAE